LIAYVVVVGNHVGDWFTHVDATTWLGSPDQLTDFSRDYCSFLKGKASSLVHVVEAYNRRHGFRKISFSSEQGDSVTAWYLPSPSEATAPRVVLLHGLDYSPISSSVQTASYMLRLMDVSALILDLNVNVQKGASKMASLFDSVPSVVAAWEYAANDPDGLLGGPVNSSSVGLMGFAYGGYAAQAAFVSDGRIPAILVDGVIHDVQALLRSDVRRHSSSLNDWLVMQAESRCSENLQTHFDKMKSMGELFVDRDGEANVGLIHSAQDQSIPDEQRHKFKDFFHRALGKDSLLLDWHADFANQLDEECDAGQVHLVDPLEYHEKLCSFWAKVFYGSTARCPEAVDELRRSLA